MPALRRELWYHRLEGLLPPPPLLHCCCGSPTTVSHHDDHRGGRPAVTVDGAEEWIGCYDAGPLHFGLWQSDADWLRRPRAIGIRPVTPCPAMEIALCNVDPDGAYIVQRLALYLSPHPAVTTDARDAVVFSVLPDLGAVVGQGSELHWDPTAGTLKIAVPPLPPVVVAQLSTESIAASPLHLVLSLSPNEAVCMWEIH